MAIPSIQQTEKMLRFDVSGSRRPSNYFFALVLTGGGLGFLLAGLSSFLKVNLLPFADTSVLSPFPQGATMAFYGTLALLFATYYWVAMTLDIGSGYNQFDKEKRTVTIFRRGFPGKNRTIEIDYPFDNIQGLRVEMKGGLNPRRALFLKLKGTRDVLLSPVSQPPSLEVVEDQASAIAKFMNVGIEGI
jgi:Ycf4